MSKHKVIVYSLVALLCVTGLASAEVIEFFRPVGGGTASGSSYSSIWPVGFNNQSGTTLDTTDITWIEAGGTTSIGLYTASPIRWGYLDFGADWASVNITDTWTGFRASSDQRTAETWVNNAWWDSDTTNTESANAVAATEIISAWNNWQPPTISGMEWVKQPDSGFTPQGRYLIVEQKGSADVPTANTAVRVSEIIFSTTSAVIPEPGSALMLLMGLVGAVLFRKR